ncbi:hypothetical protein CPB85DRAFT_1284072 [Mucidula mucida]|nr:hypothetical protein CPB85DRAFT_1284072 [Mucidula mucida]
MALRSSPRKVVPLATGEEIRPRSDTYGPSSSTKRVFFCGVVVEGSESGKRLPDEIQDLVLSLGDLLETDEAHLLDSTAGSDSADSTGAARKRALTDSSALTSVINELVATERSYVKRLQILKNDYADPLRNFSRSRSTAILPSYEAKTMFGNVDNLLPVNEAFLTDLEKMMAPNGAKTVGGIGDVALRHFKQLRGFEQYRQYYVKREDAQMIFEREMSKRSSPFAAYIDRIKYQSTDTRNRVGLRELLMDPVQRIPRYTLMFRTMIKYMAPGDPQRAKLIEADEIASKIALAEADEQTKRATIFYCLSSNIQEFPPDLFSNSRRFIDCIDVEDVFSDAPSNNSSSASLSTVLHCSLILFDDKLLIVKRPGNGEKGCRALSGLDDVEKVTKTSSMSGGKRKNAMSFKGVMDITEVVVTDVGGPDFHLYLENAPQELTERWSNRPLRFLTVVKPPGNVDPTGTEADKTRFLRNLWTAQAKYRTRAGQSVVLQSEEVEVESKNGRVTAARTYYNVYQRTAFLQEIKKTKIVVHIDAVGGADNIPFGVEGPPFAVIRLQPLAGGVCRYKVTSTDPSDPGEEDIVQTSRVPNRIILTIHQYGLFEFRTGRANSRPSTPTARSKVSIFGLDAISRNLFNSRPVGDFFAGSINSHRRSKSTNSRSSTYTHTTTTGDDSLTRFSHRSNSTIATTMSTMDDDSFGSNNASPTRGVKRGYSPVVPERPSSRNSRAPSRSQSRAPPRSRSSSRGGDTDCSDLEEDDSFMATARDMDASERNLALQLKLARKNSKSQYDRAPSKPLPVPLEAPIMEDETSLRPASRASTSRDSNSQCTVTADSDNPRRTRSMSRHSSDRRPMGPRTPSPLPPTSHLLPSALSSDSESEDIVRPLTQTQSRPTGIPRSKRQPFLPTGNTEMTPKPLVNNSTGGSIIEPLSIKKKSTARSTTNAPLPPAARRSQTSPLARTQPRTTPALQHNASMPDVRPSLDASHAHINPDQLLQVSRATKVDLDSAYRAVKRMRVELETLQSSKINEPYSRPSSPVKGLSTPSRGAPLTKAAQERMEEMQKLIGQRQGEGTPLSRPRPFSAFDTPTRAPSFDGTDAFKPLIQSIAEADDSLMQGINGYNNIQGSLEELSTAFREQSADINKYKTEVQNSKRQCEVMKSLLNDVTAEKEIMFEAFNEELDGMYNDINLPDDEAWEAMTSDLQRTKEARNALSKENQYLKRQLAETTLKYDEWEALLRSHGLIP